MSRLSNFLVESLLNEIQEGTIVLFPGGFKPPHGGHFELAKRYASEPTVSQVIILIGPEPRDGITREQSIAVWRELIKSEPKILIQQTEINSPLAAAYKYIETAKPGTYALAASSKGEDYARVKGFVKGHEQGGKYAREGVFVRELPLDTAPIVYKNRSPKAANYVPGKSENGKGISASVLRADLKNNDKEAFATSYPNITDKAITDRVFDILKKNVSEEIAPSDLFSRIKARFKDFLQKIEQEKEETKQAFALLAQSAQGKRKLTPEEQKQVGEQMRDVLKTMGLGVATVLPGGTIYFLLIKLLKLEKYTLPSSFRTNENISSISKQTHLLLEGGAAGHLAHPYEDMDLTFGEIKKMIELALGGKLEYAQEKLDGQNLMVTYKDGAVRAARNKGQVKNYGENSLTTDQMAKMFEGRGPIQTAFVETMKDLEAAINKLSPEQKAQFFENGKKFISLEVLFPETANVIPYGAAQLRLHHIKSFDINGNVEDEDVAGIYELQKALDLTQASQQKTFMIRTTDPAKLKADLDLPNQLKQFTSEVDKIKSKYNLSNSKTARDYIKRWWTDFIKNKASELKYTLPAEVLDALIARWAFTDKSTKITDIRGLIDNQAFRMWVDQFDKTQVESTKKIALKPIEMLFLKLGVRVLQNIENLTALSPDEAKRKVKQDVSAAIRGIQKAADTETIEDADAAIKFLKRELTRLKDIGGFNAIVPTEGLVFKYKGKLYKLTGAFAPINQILGYLRF